MVCVDSGSVIDFVGVCVGDGCLFDFSVVLLGVVYFGWID